MGCDTLILCLAQTAAAVQAGRSITYPCPYHFSLSQAPGLPYVLPREYIQQGLPILTGRATVELKVEKADGSTAFTDSVNGGINRTGTVRLGRTWCESDSL